MKKFFISIVSISILALILSVFVPIFYIRFEIQNYLYRIQEIALTTSDLELKDQINSFVDELGRKITINSIEIQREEQNASISVKYSENVCLPLLKPAICFFDFEQKVLVK